MAAVRQSACGMEAHRLLTKSRIGCRVTCRYSRNNCTCINTNQHASPGLPIPSILLPAGSEQPRLPPLLGQWFHSARYLRPTQLHGHL